MTRVRNLSDESPGQGACQDMQEKGIFTIGGSVEWEYGVDLNPDEIQPACDDLSPQHLLNRYPDSGGDVFYRRVSPLGEDDSTG